MKTAHGILKEMLADARKGSCRDCCWCISKEDDWVKIWEYLYDARCLVQSCYNPLFFTIKELGRRRYPQVCDEGNFGIPICLAFMSKAIYSHQDNYCETDHREYLVGLRKAVELEKQLLAVESGKLQVDLNAILAQLNFLEMCKNRLLDKSS